MFFLDENFQKEEFFVAEKAATIRKLPCLSLLHVCERKRERESKKERVNVRVFERQTSRMCVCMSERKSERKKETERASFSCVDTTSTRMHDATA